MDEEPSTSRGIIHSIPQELQDEVDSIASKLQRVTATSADLTDNQKRWLIVGICLHSVIVPALRTYIVPIFKAFYKELIRIHKIDTQKYPTHLQWYRPTNAFLNYEVVNNNTKQYGNQKSNYDYMIKNYVDLSKLFLQTHMTFYTGFDETCDSSALLGLIINIDKFPPLVKSDAENVRRNLRNPWAHCDLTTWDAGKYSNAFKMMEKLVIDLSLNVNDENQIKGKLKKWELTGESFLSGTTVGLELVNEILQQTCVLGEYGRQITTGTDANFMRVNTEIEQIVNIIDQLKTDMEEIDKKVKAHDKILKIQHTHLDSHNVEMELWKEQDVMFVETPVVEDLSLILESEHSVLIVGEPGIGKSMLMHHVALKLHSTMNYIIIPCSAIKDIYDHYKMDKKQMFVLDDIYGRFTASFGKIEWLEENREFLKTILGKGKTKIAASCRLDIYSDENVHASCTVFSSNIFNLSEKYLKENRLKICAKYLTKTNIQLLKDENVEFTPFMCYLYSKNENFNLTDFLHCPSKTYQNEWKKLKSIDPYKYCALFLCVLHNGIIEESLFDIYSENISSKNFKWETIFEICELNKGTSRCKMKAIYDSLIGTYVRKTRNTYGVIHNQMFDFMCSYFGNQDSMVRCILRYASIQLLNERTQLESINEQHRKFTILITHKYEEEYFERIQNELKLGNLEECSRNIQMNHEIYRASFIKALNSIEGPFSQKFNKDYSDFFIISCSRGYYDTVQFYISKDVDLENEYLFETPLKAACRGGHEKIVKLLIDKGCNVNQADGKSRTPLTAACGGGHEKIVQLLIDKGCNVNQADGMRQTPLIASSEGGYENIVQLLIEKGCNVNQANRMTRTALTDACRRGYENIAQLLIDKGCNVNQIDNLGQTPLTAACMVGNENMVRLLIDNGCDIYQVDGERHTPLLAACNGGNKKIVLLLINRGCDIYQNDSMRRTTLTAACVGDNANIIQFLIDKGCDIHQTDGMGQTPLTAACERGHEKIVQFLHEKGCDIHQTDGIGQKPLTAACESGNEKIVQFLIDKGCDVHKANGMSQTPLIAACEGGNEKIVQCLIDKGCDVNQFDGFGRTSLTAACVGGNEKIVQLLIDKGCDILQTDGMLQTPLDVAFEQGYGEIQQLLIDRKRDV